ncbi:hypothetical protein DXA95_12225 [Odoribacter sp. OF09-27XD]|jgi:hypothetical protein|nr:hypothetical protein [Odoribacter sp. OF09-27XD]RHV92565.1 hypothetical protein DXA95_12225 [Odoribacter sp. OF09-27XD]DAV89695.1 MAG TPA: hypothetical protein [Bacteriophage sp.]
MGSDKTFVFAPEGGTGGGMNSILAMIPGLLQGKGGLDPNLVAALMSNKNNQDGWGGAGCWWIWIILLFFVFGWGGNGFGGFGGRNGGGLPAELNGDAGRELLMNAIQGNGTAINQLASSLNCSTQQLQGAICNLQGSIDKVAGQVGMTGQQVINSIQSMGCQIGNQIASCCCDVRTAIERQGYESQLAIVNQTNTLTGNANTQFNILGAKIDAQTQIINDKFCQLEMREMQHRIDELSRENNQLALSASQQAQTANIVSQLKAPCPVPAYIVQNPNCCATPVVTVAQAAAPCSGITY